MQLFDGNLQLRAPAGLSVEQDSQEGPGLRLLACRCRRLRAAVGEHCFPISSTCCLLKRLARRDQPLLGNDLHEQATDIP